MNENKVLEQAISLINEKIRFCEEQIHVWLDESNEQEAFAYTAKRMGLLEAIEVIKYCKDSNESTTT